jgi:hypothetical protein
MQIIKKVYRIGLNKTKYDLNEIELKDHEGSECRKSITQFLRKARLFVIGLIFEYVSISLNNQAEL